MLISPKMYLNIMNSNDMQLLMHASFVKYDTFFFGYTTLQNILSTVVVRY